MSPHEILGVSPDADETAIRAAYAAKLKAAHPDHGGSGQDITALKDARDTLLARPKKATTCRVCGGSGWVKTGGFKPERCPRDC